MTDDPEEPVYERFRLSRMEFFVLARIYNFDALGVVMSPTVHREWEAAWANDDYPFRNDERDESPIVGVTIGLMPV